MLVLRYWCPVAELLWPGYYAVWVTVRTGDESLSLARSMGERVRVLRLGDRHLGSLVLTANHRANGAGSHMD